MSRCTPARCGSPSLPAQLRPDPRGSLRNRVYRVAMSQDWIPSVVALGADLMSIPTRPVPDPMPHMPHVHQPPHGVPRRPRHRRVACRAEHHYVLPRRPEGHQGAVGARRARSSCRMFGITSWAASTSRRSRDTNSTRSLRRCCARRGLRRWPNSRARPTCTAPPMRSRRRSPSSRTSLATPPDGHPELRRAAVRPGDREPGAVRHRPSATTPGTRPPSRSRPSPGPLT